MANPFLTLQDISDLLGRDVTADPGGTAALSAACQICRTEAQQDFNAGTATIHLDGHDGDALLLPQQPVGTVSAVSVNGVVITDFCTTAEGLLVRGAAGSRPTTNVTPSWPLGRQNVQVSYTSGYPDLAVPDDVAIVAAQLAERIMIQGIVQSETVGDVSVTYSEPDALALTEGEKRILRRYRGSRSF